MSLLVGKQYSEIASQLTVPWIFETSSFSCIILYPPIAIAEVHCLLKGYHYWLSRRLQEAGKLEIPFDVLNHSDFPAGRQMSQDKSLEHKRIKKKKNQHTKTRHTLFYAKYRNKINEMLILILWLLRYSKSVTLCKCNNWLWFISTYAMCWWDLCYVMPRPVQSVCELDNLCLYLCRDKSSDFYLCHHIQRG